MRFTFSIGKAEAEHFDYYVFAQQWPATTCTKWKSGGSFKSCNFPNMQVWTVHGVWPSRHSGRGPEYCDADETFSPAKIADIETDLSNQWTDVQAKSDRYQFWEYEWRKHGTCASFDSVSEYFRRGLLWQEATSLAHVFRTSGLHPSNDNFYDFNDFFEAVSRQVGTKALIKCHQSRGRSLLHEVRICYSKNLETMDCPKYKSDCGNKVLYLDYHEA